MYQIGFTNLLNWFTDEFRISETDRVLVISSLSFDLTQKNVYAALIRGGTLHLLNSGLYDPNVIIDSIRRNQITLLNCTPSAFYPLTELTASKDFAPIASLRYVILGGEPISLQTVRPWLTSITCDAIVANTYGPTECTDIATFYLLDRTNVDSHDFTPIGKPIYNSKIIVVDRHLEPCPVGVPGELCIGGIGVGAGYLNNPKLTTDKFVRNPFPEIESEQLYKTGDLVRYLPSGAIEYLGRLDHQVKIRGFRIELGEIESVLAGFPGVREAVVIAREDVPGEKRLVAYFSARRISLQAALRAHLERALPEYMVPAAYVRLGALPLTPNGKLDRRALPAPGDHAFGAQAYEAPKGPIETAIAAIWAEFLHLERVGRHDDFFKLGGHSLMALRVIGEINKALKARLHVPAFFQNPTDRASGKGSLSRSIMSDTNRGWCSCSPGVPACRSISLAPGQKNIGWRNCLARIAPSLRSMCRCRRNGSPQSRLRIGRRCRPWNNWARSTPTCCVRMLDRRPACSRDTP